MRRVFEWLTVNAYLGLVAGVMGGTFFLAYRGIVWLGPSDVAHGILGAVAIGLSIAAGAAVGYALTRRSPSPNRARARR